MPSFFDLTGKLHDPNGRFLSQIVPAAEIPEMPGFFLANSTFSRYNTKKYTLTMKIRNIGIDFSSLK